MHPGTQQQYLLDSSAPQYNNYHQAQAHYSPNTSASANNNQPPNINNYTMIKEALIQHSRQKRKAMGGASVQSQKKKRQKGVV